MQKNFVLTVTGPDRIGIVERVTGLLFEQGGNVETSRMARLGGEFAMLLLVAMPEGRIAGLDGDLALLAADGYKVTTTPTDRSDAGTRPDWLPYRIEVEGADDEGIIHEVAGLPFGTRDQYRVCRIGNDPGTGERLSSLCHDSAGGRSSDRWPEKAGRPGSKKSPIA